MSIRRFAFLLFVCCCCPIICVGQLKPFATVNLNIDKGNVGGCDAKWTINRSVWIDEEHLVARLLRSCRISNSKHWKTEEELAFIDTRARVRTVSKDKVFAVMRGPSGTLLVGHDDEVDLMNSELQVLQTIRCPTEKRACGVFPSPAGANDFALCSVSGDVENCNFYRGLPSVQVTGDQPSFPVPSKISHSPFATLPETVKAWNNRSEWKVSEDEVWYFDKDGILSGLNSNGSPSPVSTEKWTPTDSNCTGDISATEPRRFLATCVGTHFYTDGDLDAIFGFSRIALFDVTSRRILARINGPAYTSAALSPSGKSFAVTHDRKVRLYRVD
jgi:hypothetical protein